MLKKMLFFKENNKIGKPPARLTIKNKREKK